MAQIVQLWLVDSFIFQICLLCSLFGQKILFDSLQCFSRFLGEIGFRRKAEAEFLPVCLSLCQNTRFLDLCPGLVVGGGFQRVAGG